MKSFNKVLGNIKRKPTAGGTTPPDARDAPTGDSPEAIAARSVKLFCESGTNSAGDEVTFLPPIVEAAESSPAAAAECARLVRKYLHKDYWTGPSFQYNAIMLMRILADNPGMTFTRNMAEKKFVETIKDLLRNGRDPSVRQMLMETLDSFEAEKGYDEGLVTLIDMWRREKEKAYKAYGGRAPVPPVPRTLHAPAFNPHSQNYFARSHSNRRLPDPIELANRLEEARTSAKLLTQVVQCTPPSEVLDNELIKEFADRCLSASRSIQGYMSASDPGPDNDTMESLIDTNEQLQQALNLHQRAVLGARKQQGLQNEERRERNGERDRSSYIPENILATKPGGGTTAAPPLPSRELKADKGKGAVDSGNKLQAYGASSSSGAAAAGPSRSANVTPRPEEDPFRDPPAEPTWARSGVGTGGSSAAPVLPPIRPGKHENDDDEDDDGGHNGSRLAYEPYHPGFSSTPSYINRQDSATGKVHMHGAAPPAGSDVSPVEESPVRARRESDADLYDREDKGPYGARNDKQEEAEGPGASGSGSGSGSGKAPIYRY